MFVVHHLDSDEVPSLVRVEPKSESIAVFRIEPVRAAFPTNFSQPVDRQAWLDSIDQLIDSMAPESGYEQHDNWFGAGNSGDSSNRPFDRYPWLPMDPPEDPNSSGGMIGFENGYTGGSGDIFSGHPTAEEARQLLQILSSLRYLPDSARAETHGVPTPSATTTTHDLDPNISIETNSRSELPTPLATSTIDPALPSRSSGDDRDAENLMDGGMVTLIRTELVYDGPNDQRSPPNTSLRLVPVKMDSALGRYQAFEVSTAEANVRLAKPVIELDGDFPAIEPTAMPHDRPQEPCTANPAELMSDPELAPPAIPSTPPRIETQLEEPNDGATRSRSLVCTAAGVLFIGYVAKATARTNGTQQAIPRWAPKILCRRRA